MSTPNKQAIKIQIDAFPALPIIVSKVMTVTADPESGADDLMRAVLPDQSMCSALLKFANSAFFGIPREVSTIERAVMVLGFEEVRNIVIGKTLFAAFPKLNKNFKDSVNLFWQHTFTCGLVAKIIGEELGYSPSELFIAGLIHDIGKLAMLLTFPGDYPLLRGLAEPGKGSSVDDEFRDYGISHDKVGLQLAERWLLPERLTMAIGHHHQPRQAPSHRHLPLFIQVADILSLMYCSPDIYGAQDVMEFFEDFFPEMDALWAENDLTWNIENVGVWFEGLGERYDQDQAILDIFTSS